ncbi:MAG: COR domain-containing protein, partial [Coleofasciculaceae cyanobacterium]
ELLQLMMRFKLCYPLPNHPNRYISPQLLDINQPDYDWDESDNLILRYQYDFMPKGIISRFIVETHPWIERQELVWRNGVILQKDQTRAEVIEHYYKNKIRIRVSGSRKKELLAVVTHELEKIHNSYERLQYKTLVPCNCEECKGSQEPHTYPLEALYKRLKAGRYEVECENSYQKVNVRSLIDDVSLQPWSIEKDYINQQTWIEQELDSRVYYLKQELNRRKEESLQRSHLQPTMSEITRNQVFISYSHQDKQWLSQLQKHLKPMIRNQTLNVWDDTKIKPGAEWRPEIEKALATAKVAVLMVSPDFLASDFIADNELPPLLDVAQSKGLTIIWIPFSYSSYEETEIEKYQAAHNPSQPIDSLTLPEQNKALVDICKEIKKAANF